MKYLGTPHEPTEWPAEMVIDVEDHDLELLELLFVRSAWGLAVSTDAPEIADAIAAGRSSRPAAAEGALERRWADEWAALMSGDRKVRNTCRWRDKFGWDGLDETAFDAWVFDFRAEFRVLPPVEESPEWLAGSALVDAWSRGLRRVTVLPVAHWAARRGDAELLVSAASRREPGAYRAALERFKR